ncbi:MAG TPA: nuclear transport factor 2 family protein [Pyrinomonadaceae bacterium]
MRRTILLATIILAASSLAVGQCGGHTATMGSSVEQELIKLDKDWTAAELKGDKAAVSKVVADDYQGTTAEGKVQDKAQYMEGIKASTDKDVADDYNVRVLGDMAIMTHRGTVTTTKESFQYRSTHVWAKRDGRWQLIAHHGSNIQAQAPAQQAEQAKPATDATETKPAADATPTTPVKEAAKPQPEQKKP